LEPKFLIVCKVSVPAVEMLPPSDSFRHQSHKLAEVIASLQNGVTTPPPPYVLAPEECPSSVDAEDEPADPGTRPITIHIDASINILGNSNTVILPSVPNQQQPTGSPSTSSSPDRTTGVLQATQKHRQAKLTEMATSIIAALRESDHLSHSSEHGRSEPVELSVNAGVKVEGSRNVICAGAGAGAGSAAPGRSIPSGKNGPNESHGESANAGTKRRAQSVCTALASRRVELLGMSDVTCIGTSGPTDGEEGLLVATEVACLVSQGSFLCRRGSRGRRQGIDTSRGGLHGALS
jgi:hypothetical protein